MGCEWLFGVNVLILSYFLHQQKYNYHHHHDENTLHFLFFTFSLFSKQKVKLVFIHPLTFWRGKERKRRRREAGEYQKKNENPVTQSIVALTPPPPSVHPSLPPSLYTPTVG